MCDDKYCGLNIVLVYRIILNTLLKDSIETLLFLVDLLYTAKNATDLLQVINFVSLLQQACHFIKLQQVC